MILALGATGYSVVTILLSLLQARKMMMRHASCDVSITWLSANTGGYLIWLAYGISILSVPIMVSDALGLVCGGFTLAVALAWHRSCETVKVGAR